MKPLAEEPEIKKDKKGKIRHISYRHVPYSLSKAPASFSPRDVAAQYLKEVLNIRQVVCHGITKAEEYKEKRARRSEKKLWLVSEKQVRNTSVVEFEQRQTGIRVWKSGTTVNIRSGTAEVIAATNSFDYDVPAIKVDMRKLETHAKSLTSKLLAKILLLDKNIIRARTVRSDFKLPPRFKINKIDHVIYRYDPEARQKREKAPEGGDRAVVDRLLELVLPAVDKRIEAGAYYLVAEVFFNAAVGRGSMNWHALIHPETNSILYLRPLIAQVSGWVYERDPLTTTGDNTILPGSTTHILNSPRMPKPMPGITGLPNLSGEYVKITDVLLPVVAPPTSATGRFDYDANTDDFSAVNAYFHSDGVFRMVEEMGFDMNTYFDGTSFPVPVDHRGCCACVNAAAWGNALGDGLGSFTFGLVQAGQPVGIATSVRIVLHEFGHAILWDNVHSPNFGFAHSAGDSMAALLCDPQSKAPDRFETFPWLTLASGIDRRHDRAIAAGWAWGGTNDDGQYGSEQILSTSHFRAYRSLGGDHPDICEREWAARYMTYLIIYGVGTLTPTTNPNNPEDWVEVLMASDLSTIVFEGHPGGTVHKVIRWAFEKQGAFQPAGSPTPVITEGNPPKFDIYINDGRDGEYQFTTDYCHTTAIWNRLSPDGNAVNQAPLPGVNNYAYVVVRNRGTNRIPPGTVRAYQKREGGCCGCCDNCHEMTWPNDFMPTITQEVTFGDLASGDYEIVGPFVWRPGPNDCLLMSAEAKGDPSNLSLIAPGQSLRVKRLVPFDNNIALRCMCKQCNSDYSRLEHRRHERGHEETPD